MTGAETRVEHDSMGEVQVPAEALWGAQTQRAVDNFQISERRMPRPLLRALGLIKRAAAEVNAELGLLDAARARAIAVAAQEVADGRYDAQFPIDVFQTGSGTSTNMNANEVIARLAGRELGQEVHANDHVNMSQSSNDVIPSALHLSALLELEERLRPALAHLAQTITDKAAQVGEVVKTGRTHLMDALPILLRDELGAWRQQVLDGDARLASILPRLGQLALGGTAVGSGLNAPPEFGARGAARLVELTGLQLSSSPNRFAALAGQERAVELSGQLKTIAVALMKISNDLRWMNSGPLAGLGEIALPALQPGSSIMPGKVNPVIPEAVYMAGAAVIGNDAAVTVAAQSGSFQLNVTLPLIADRLLESAHLLTGAARALADRAIAGFTVNEARLAEQLERNPILVTALNRVIGYEQGATIAKRAYAEGRPVKEVAREMTALSSEELDRLLDPLALARGGVPSGRGSRS